MAYIARTNYITNPSWEYDTVGWSTTGAATLGRYFSGFEYFLIIQWPTAAAGAASAFTTVTGLVVGQSYTVWVRVDSSNPSWQLSIGGVGTGPSVTLSDAFFKQSQLTFTATATSHTLSIVSTSATTAGNTTQADYIILEDGTVPYAYFDGDTPGAQWAASPGRSISTLPIYDTSSSPVMPLIVVEIDARPPGAGDFFLDGPSQLDGPDFLVGSPRWYPVDNVVEVNIQRGRHDDSGPISPGNMTVTIDDYAGKYDPDNPVSPLQNQGQTLLRTKGLIRAGVTWNYLGVLLYRPLFTGYIEDFDISRGRDAATVITATDLLDILNNSDIAPQAVPPGAGATSFWHVAWLFAQSQLAYSLIFLAPNTDRTLLAEGGGGNAGASLTEIADANGGRIYAKVDGSFQMTSHASEFTSTIAAVFTDQPAVNTDMDYDDITTSTSLGQIINRTVVERGDDVSTTMTAQNDDSAAANGVRSETITAPLFADSDAQALATWRASRRAKGGTRVTGMTTTLTGSPNWWINAAGLELSAIVQAHRYTRGRGIDLLLVAEGIEHDITAKNWQLSVYTSPTDRTFLFPGQPGPFILDTSALDGPDYLTAY